MTATWRDYWELTKPRIAFLVLVTAAFGFFLGGQGIHAPLLFCCLLVGTGLTTCGSSVLNHYLERDVDGLMKRTRNRPLPTGRVKPGTALSMGFVLVLSGVFFLLFTAGLLTAFLALLSAFLYVVVYTPMKRQNWLNTSLGAVPGALPPVGGWTAATGAIDPGAVVLFLILRHCLDLPRRLSARRFQDVARRRAGWEQHLLAGDGLLGAAADLFGVAFVYGAHWAVLPSRGAGAGRAVSRLRSRAQFLALGDQCAAAAQGFGPLSAAIVGVERGGRRILGVRLAPAHTLRAR
ncbi:MAG: protoheme IX farnesyltransferase [Candidatus Latescibacteria bacterium]|nr:protoheme IX farnesyltransferase [Candidatus Latescibacterota bacterium]